jgi:formate dehydrogenase subunit gamma
MPRFLELLAAGALALAVGGVGGSAFAQSNSSVPAGGSSVTTPPAPKVAPEDLAVPAAPGASGIQGQNIFEVKPEVKRDASNDPGYLGQTNGQRNRVQPGNNAPMWRQVQGGAEGVSSLPKSEALEAGNLIQQPVRYPGTRMVTAGQAWREFRNVWLIPYGGSLLIIVLLALAIFYFTQGPVGESSNQGRRRIERFTPFERAAHWSNAIAFVILGLSGITMAFGKFFLLPLIGQTLFGYFTYLLKNLHNFVGPLFVVSLVIVFFTFLRSNFPQRGDLRWLVRLGGMIGKKEVPSHRFNAGEKLVFWGGVLVLGVIVVASGLVMDKLVPTVAYYRYTMQLTHMIHASAAVLMLAVFFGHIYMGTVGMRGAYTAMRTGYVDDAWAREHHEYWYEDVKSGRIPAQRSRPLTIVDDTGETVRPA